MTRSADLHVHTNFSDSTSSPATVVEEARRQEVDCIALTDHDTLDAIPVALEAAAGCGPEILPGIELSCEFQNKDIHILGYLFDIRDKNLNQQLTKFREARVARIRKMVEKLKEQGIDNIAAEEVLRLTESDAVGRPHLASLLVEKGWVPSRAAAFDRYLAEDRPAYVAKFKQTPHEAIELIHKAGGVAVLAHPMITGVDELIPGLAAAGLDGLEVYYPHSFPVVIQFYEGLAKKYKLLTTGGSDAHGEDRSHAQIGYVKIPYELVEALKARAARYKQTGLTA